ncbi:helix-turn-helix domain-containing protein [Luteolibacter sp. AS25]|uniref:helix-turn-helix domain-containing protein n=1 Tax=Luteolibacter sp. AS25 TaxID=3135776 RepID=UPI00398A6DE6
MDKITTFKARNPVQIVRSIGNRIREHRLAKGWTQAELAERSGVGLSTLKLLEREGKGSLQRLAKIAVVLNLDGELRGLFAEQVQYESMEEVERTKRQRGTSSK